MTVHPLFKNSPQKQRLVARSRAATLSAQLVAEVRQALFEKRLKSGDFLGGEQDIADQRGVSRIVARDALRTLEALGIVEIKVGSGGGARIARGDTQRFAEALAVQLELAGIDVADIMDAQRAVETLAAELAAEHATAADLARLKALLEAGDRAVDDVAAFTRNGAEFHLAVAEASHNRVLAVQLQSLQHVSWPSRNPTLTHDVAAHVQSAHRDLVKLIEMHDPSGARRLMDDHVKMIRARRIAEHGTSAARNACC
jgi:GntR family transcriptional regulator, transcriptional repressor for pyruvate dehydrogenase complex